MKKYLTFWSAVILTVPYIACADMPVSTAALSTLQNQINQLQQQVENVKQSMVSANQSLNDTTQQLGTLQNQLAQYGNPALSQFKWVDSNNGILPPAAYVAGKQNGQSLYICQAAYSNGSGYYGNGNTIVEPGVVVKNGCIITYSGQAYLVPSYSVLTSNTAGYWISGEYIKSDSSSPIRPLFMAAAVSAPQTNAGNSQIDRNEATPLYNALALIGGQENSANVYICRAEINGQYFIGKSMNNTCYIAAGKYEASWPVYQILLIRKP